MLLLLLNLLRLGHLQLGKLALLSSIHSVEFLRAAHHDSVGESSREGDLASCFSLGDGAKLAPQLAA